MSMRELPDVWARYRETGDMDARQELVMEYLPMTRYVASQISQRLPQSVEFEDLVAYGAMGLLDAIEKFDLDKGVKFGTYAVSRIRGAILDELRSQDWVPRSVRTKARMIEQVIADLSAELGRSPDDREVAEALGLDDEQYAELSSAARVRPMISLDASLSNEPEDPSGHVRADMIEDVAADDPLSSRISGEVAETVASVIARLDVRQRTVLTLYCVEELNLSRIGEVMGVTESRVCQMHTRSVAAIQDELRLRGAGMASSD